MSDRRVLVVGTTSDYIDIIRRRFSGRALFVTDAGERERASEPAPDGRSELLCDLARPDAVVAALRDHLGGHDIEAAGVACFDCESMALAAYVARSFSLPYVSPEAVVACRSKLISKQLWREAGLPCPRAGIVGSASEAVRFARDIRGPVVVKPLTGSGSELLFVCSDKDECVAAVRTIKARLAHHTDERMYKRYVYAGSEVDPRRAFAIEEFVCGPEYSCDFLVDGDRVEIVRIALKVPDRSSVPGTTLAYVLPVDLPPGVVFESFRNQLRDAAHALGVVRAVCMLDFIVDGGKAVMLELTPRPGGDCLPPLVLASCGLDMLGLALDFAEGCPVAIPDRSRWRRLVGLRLFASRAGAVRRIDTRAALADPRVLECCIRRAPGHRVVLPPENYDSRLLGHVIFAPSSPEGVEREVSEIAAKVGIEMEDTQ